MKQESQQLIDLAVRRKFTVGVPHGSRMDEISLESNTVIKDAMEALIKDEDPKIKPEDKKVLQQYLDNKSNILRGQRLVILYDILQSYESKTG